MREVYRAYQKETHDTMVTPVPGAREALERLRSAGMSLGVVTSKSLPVALEGLNLFDLASFFATLVTYEDTTRHKPNPDPLFVAAERMGLEPGEMIYVGDAVVDVQAGKAAGMRTAAVIWGAGQVDALRAAQPDFMVDTMQELADRLAPPRVGSRPTNDAARPALGSSTTGRGESAG
jgi:pyrophosphatase PpaX